MKKILQIVVPVVLIVLLLWFVRTDSTEETGPASTPDTQVDNPAPSPTVETSEMSEQTDSKTEEPQAWTPYIGSWTGSVTCHSSTYRTGDELIGSADLVINEDGSLTLTTKRRFVADNVVHGDFSEDGQWPGRFDDRDGNVYFTGPDEGMVKCIWLGTIEQNIVIPLSRAIP